MKKKIFTTLAAFMVFSQCISTTSNAAYTSFSVSSSVYTYDESTCSLILKEQISPITELTAGAFSGFNGFEYYEPEGDDSYIAAKKIQLPDTLKSIEKDTFRDAKYLTEIEIPETLEEADYETFVNCIRLKKIVNHSKLSFQLPQANKKGEKPYTYYVNGKETDVIHAGETAIGEPKTYQLSLDFMGGKRVGKTTVTSFTFGQEKTIQLPKAKKKNCLFLGWSTYKKDNLAWYNVNKQFSYLRFAELNTDFWMSNQTLYAKYMKVQTKRTKKNKVRLILSGIESSQHVIIEYSKNKNFKNYDRKVITVRGNFTEWRKKNYIAQYYGKKKKMVLTINKNIKKGTTYYVRFRFAKYEDDGLDWTGDTTKTLKIKV